MKKYLKNAFYVAALVVGIALLAKYVQMAQSQKIMEANMKKYMIGMAKVQFQTEGEYPQRPRLTLSDNGIIYLDDDTVFYQAAPVVLSEDGSFWYDQRGKEMALDDAEIFLAKHYGYCFEILPMNKNKNYLSAWRDEVRIDKIDELYRSLISDRKLDDMPNHCDYDDDLCIMIAEQSVNNPANMGVLTSLKEKINFIDQRPVESLGNSIWNRRLEYNYYVSEYIFWNTVTHLIDDEVYSVADINNYQEETVQESQEDAGVTRSSGGKQYGPPPRSAFDTEAAQPVPIDLSGGNPDEGYSMDGPSETPDEDENVMNNGSEQMWDWE